MQCIALKTHSRLMMHFEVLPGGRCPGVWAGGFCHYRHRYYLHHHPHTYPSTQPTHMPLHPSIHAHPSNPTQDAHGYVGYRDDETRTETLAALKFGFGRNIS